MVEPKLGLGRSVGRELVEDMDTVVKNRGKGKGMEMDHGNGNVIGDGGVLMVLEMRKNEALEAKECMEWIHSSNL